MEAGLPTGFVTVLDNGVQIATLPLNASGGVAFSSSNLKAGSHQIDFVYSGDQNEKGSSSGLAINILDVVSPTVTKPQSSPATQGSNVQQQPLGGELALLAPPLFAPGNSSELLATSRSISLTTSTANLFLTTRAGGGVESLGDHLTDKESTKTAALETNRGHRIARNGYIAHDEFAVPNVKRVSFLFRSSGFQLRRADLGRREFGRLGSLESSGRSIGIDNR